MNKIHRGSHFKKVGFPSIIGRKESFWLFLLLLVCEIAIALFHFHPFVRYFVGDVLAIPLLWSLGKWTTRLTRFRVLWLVLLFAVLIELLQTIPITYPTKEASNLIGVFMGNTFDYKDLIAYGLGFLIVFINISKSKK